MGNYTAAQLAARTRYNRKTYDRITLRVPKGEKSDIQQAARGANKSMTRYILDACRKEMKPHVESN